MKNKNNSISRSNRTAAASVLVVVLILGIFAALYFYAHDAEENTIKPTEYAEYEKGRVIEILMDNCEVSEVAENAYRGDQKLLVKVTSGQYKGETMLVSGFVGPIYGEPAKVGQSVVLSINTYANGDHTATVYEYNRTPIVFLILGIFVLVTIAVGGRTGAKSVLGLILTMVVILMVFLPLLMKGWLPIPTSFLLCSLVAVVCFVILGGCSKKVLCACIGTIGGVAFSMLFGILTQKLLHLDGLRATDAEALLQLRQTGTPVHIRGLLVAGVIISALGAVMDVAMSIASAQSELKAVDPDLSARALWRSGMNIGRDMVGTMTNTLILALVGSSLVLMIYLSSLEPSFSQLMSGTFFSVEMVQAIASSVGVILAVPLSALIGAFLFAKHKK